MEVRSKEWSFCSYFTGQRIRRRIMNTVRWEITKHPRRAYSAVTQSRGLYEDGRKVTRVVNRNTDCVDNGNGNGESRMCLLERRW